MTPADARHARWGSPPSRRLGWSLAIGLMALWALVRIVVFSNELFPLTYVLPLLLCVWTRSRRMLFTMAAVFVGLAFVEMLGTLPGDVSPRQRLAVLSATLINILVGVVVVHLILLLQERLEQSLVDLGVANAEIRDQYEKIEAQTEELAQQNEELAQQSEELTVQNEELSVQADEVQALNMELHRREALLQSLLEATRLQSSEEQVLHDVARAGVTILGDGAAAAVLVERRGDRLEVLAAASADGEPPPLSSFVLIAGTPSFEELVLELGRPAALDDASRRPDLTLLQPLQGRRFNAALCAPFRTSVEAPGLLSVYSTAPFEWTAEQYRLIEWLAAQCGRALEALRLQRALHDREEEQRRIAITLQENFIHPLPAVDGLDMAVAAETATDLELVGGDFHDVFDLPGGKVAIVIGDVEGKGVRAAGLSETVRSAVRALAAVAPSARYVLNQVNRVLLGQQSEQFVTALLLLVDRASGEVTVASAGHPAPVRVSVTETTAIDLPFGPPLGTFEWDYDQAHFTLQTGDILVVFSDGLTEARRGGVLFGEEGVLQVLRTLRDSEPADIVSSLATAALEFAGRRQDDVQVLAVRYTAVSGAGRDGATLQLAVPADPAYLVDVRSSVRDFLSQHRVEEDTVDDVVLCVAEACGNTLLHSGSSTPAQLQVAIHDDRIEASVSDEGVGLKPRAVHDAGLPEGLALGGRGLFLIRSLGNAVQVDARNGACIVMSIARPGPCELTADAGSV